MEKQDEGVQVVEDGRKTDAALFSWPWNNFGNYKAWISLLLCNYLCMCYICSSILICIVFMIFLCVVQYLLYGPFLAKFIHSMYWKESMEDVWCLHILILCGLRGLVHQLWSTYSNMLYLNRRRRVSQQGIDYEQIDNEWHWYIYIYI